jgi:Tol biopolymer transport system component
MLPFWNRLMSGLTLIGLSVILLAFLIGYTLPRQTIAFVSTQAGTSQIYLMDIGYSLSHKLSDKPVIACCALWSPDGTQIVFPSLDESAAKLFVMDWDGGNLHRLTTEKRTNEGSAVWSPDGTKIAFVFISLQSNQAAIYVIDADSGNLRALTHNKNATSDFAPVWSPDGTKILFVSDLSADGSSRLRDTELFTMNPDGTDREQITNDAAEDSAAAYSPDGKQIVFTATPPDYFPISIYRMDADGQHYTLITEQDVSRNAAPSWSPDGEHILFLSHRDGDVEFYRVNVNGGDLQQLTDNQAVDWLPSWSPDGKHILFLSSRDGDAAVYLMDADGENPRRLTVYPATDSFAAWQP